MQIRWIIQFYRERSMRTVTITFPSPQLRSGWYVSLFIACSSFLYTPYLSADDAAQKSLFDLPLQDVLSIGVSTASKLGTKSELSPGNITVITQDDISRYGYRTIGEAVNSVPGFYSVDLGSDTNLALRGIANTKFTPSARVLVLIDGKRVNDFSYDQAFLNDSFPLDIESVERIEVLKGAGSAVWGSDAVYGVINVISKDGKSARNKQLVAEVGKNRNKAYVSWGDVTDGGAKYHIGASEIRVNGKLKTYTPAFDQPETNNGIATGNRDYKSHSVNGRFEYDNFFLDGVANLYPTDADNNVLQSFESEGFANLVQSQGMVQSGYTFDIDRSNDSKLLVRGFFSSLRYLGAAEYPESPDTTNNIIDHYRIYEKYAGTEVRYSQKITDSLKALVGAEWIRVYDARESYRARLYDEAGTFLELLPDPLDVDRDRTMKSGFFDINYQQSKELGFFVGGRLEYASNLDPVFAPRAAAVYNPVESTVLKFLYSEGFRNPGISESKIFEADPQPLQAESVRAYEVLWEQHLNKDTTFKTSLFYNDLRDSLGVLERDALYEYFTNFKGFRSKGVELELRGKFNDVIRGYTNLMIARAYDKDDGSRLITSPDYLGRVGLSFGYNDMYFLSPEIIYGGSSTVPSTEDPGEHKFDPFIFENITLLSYPMGKNARISTSIYNVTNSKYLTYAGRGHAMEAGREYVLNLSWAF